MSRIALQWIMAEFYVYYLTKRGRDSSVGIATRYGLDGPGIESQWRPTQPPIRWVPGLSWG